MTRRREWAKGRFGVFWSTMLIATLVCVLCHTPDVAAGESPSEDEAVDADESEPSNALKYTGSVFLITGCLSAVAGGLLWGIAPDPAPEYGEDDFLDNDEKTALVADIALIIGGSLVASGLIMIIIHETVIAQDPTSNEESAGLFVTPWVADDGAGLSLQLRW